MVNGDKVLICRECGHEFTFSQTEKHYYEQKGFSEPRRCPNCRKSRREATQARKCSGCNVELASAQPVYCSQCLEKARLELESKLLAFEEELAVAKASEKTMHDSLRQIEETLSEKEVQDSACVKELKEVHISNEELQRQLEEIKVHELDLTRSVTDRESRVNELTGELERARKELDDFRLRLELAQISLKDVQLAAENERLHTLEETATVVEKRVSHVEEQSEEYDKTAYAKKAALGTSQSRGLMSRLWHLLHRTAE